MLDINKSLKIMMIEKGIQQQELAIQLEFSKNGFNNYLRRGSFKIDDIVNIANTLGYDTKIIFVDRATGKRILCE